MANEITGSIRGKIILVIVLPIVLIGQLAMIFTSRMYPQALSGEIQKEGLNIADNVSRRSINGIFDNDLFMLDAVVTEASSKPNISYVFLTDSVSSEVLAHSFTGIFPEKLLRVNMYSEQRDFNIELLNVSGEHIYDIAYPVEYHKQVIGIVRLGISKEKIQNRIERASARMLGIFILLTALITWFGFALSGKIVGPIKDLTDAAKKISEGDLDVKFKKDTLNSGGEVSQLAQVFSEMTEKLREYHSGLEEKVKTATGNLQDVNHKMQRRTEELEAVNKELEHFTYVVSHDLKEPLRGIDTFSQFLLEDYYDKIDDDGKDYLKRVSAAAARMRNLIDDVLALSRISRIKNPYETVDPARLIEDAVKRLGPIIEEKNAQVNIDDELPHVSCDKVKMTEVFYNFIANALKYNDKEKPLIDIGFKDEKFFVRDNGIGIDEEHFETVFQIFKRLHGRAEYGGGTGAGLAIVKKIIEEHGGKVELESVKGEGTVFSFNIPKEKE
jgi:signal transduction histidine kinase